ncbi:MAG: glycoside hydrolase family 88 protein [Planctomycetota bacterium]|nr:glycoside hydrolase family 88 protein [Planctomycetota bacterium]
MPLQRLPLLAAGPLAALPDGFRGLAGFPIRYAQPALRLRLERPAGRAAGKLLLVVGLDCRFEAALTFEAPWAGWSQRLDASFVSSAQRLYVELPEAVVGGLHAHELLVANEGEAPLAFVAPEAEAPGLVPRVLLGRPDEPVGEALERLREPAYAPFGWIGGCVLEGLQLLGEASGDARCRAAQEALLARYLGPQGLAFEDPRGRLTTGQDESIESTLPYATLARLQPGHPALETALAVWSRKRQPDGGVRDHSDTCEGNYTVAYPMMLLGRQSGDARLLDSALRQLRRRRETLVLDGDVYLRHADGQRSFRNWTRGICWYLLGLARTLEAAERPPADLLEHLAERAAWIAARQRPDGLWDNFLDEPGPPPDTSGSCGIAAALLRARQAGLLEADCGELAGRAFAAAAAFLAPDGYLAGVAPNNKRGEAAQHTGRRTCEPFALGLFGQLAAALLRERRWSVKARA